MEAVETQAEATQADVGRVTCAGCGASFPPAAFPLMRCPNCGARGMADHAGRNFLPASWECARCHAENSGATNFCLTCGAGLASQCRRCERPVYTAVCSACGAHQAHLLVMEKLADDHADWQKEITQRIREQKEVQARREADAARKAQQASVPDYRGSSSRRYRRRSGWRWMRWPGGMVWVGLGLWLISRSRDFFTQAQAQPSTPAVMPQLPTEMGSWLSNWWAGFVPSLGQVGGLTPQDPEYLYLFASALIGLVSLPALVYLVSRVARRLFP